VAIAKWEKEQSQQVNSTADALPKRSASVKAEAFLEEHMSGSGAGDADEEGGSGAARKRRRVAQYAGLGNLAENENDDVTCKACRVEFASMEEKVRVVVVSRWQWCCFHIDIRTQLCHMMQCIEHHTASGIQSTPACLLPTFFVLLFPLLPTIGNLPVTPDARATCPRSPAGITRATHSHTHTHTHTHTHGLHMHVRADTLSASIC
jgi:hypothetical protein